jgi:hypothetical protein
MVVAVFLLGGDTVDQIRLWLQAVRLALPLRAAVGVMLKQAPKRKPGAMRRLSGWTNASF